MNAQQLFSAGDLQGAVQALTDELKRAPTDAQRRTFLFELLSFSGELERAHKQLDVIGHQDAMAEPAAQVFRNILHAETLRRRVFEEGLRPEFLGDVPAHVEIQLAALGCLRQGRTPEAIQQLEEAEQQRPHLSGSLNGTPFDDFRDCDDRVAPVIELILIRDYVWIPTEQIAELELSAPERPRDLLWAAARCVLRDGTQHRGYIPVLYPDSYRHELDSVKLGRMTDWSDESPIRGQGQRTFLAGEEGVPVLEIRQLTFSAATTT